MADPTTLPSLRQGKLSPKARTRPENPLLEQPNFGYRSKASHQTYLSAANANSFVALETINLKEEDFKHTQEETGERWVFQASRKQAPRFVSLGKAPPPPNPHPNVRLRIRKQKKENPLRGTQLFLYLFGHLCTPGTRIRQSKSLASFVQGKKQPEGDSSQRQEQRLAKPSTPHQMHERIRRGVDPGVGP